MILTGQKNRTRFIRNIGSSRQAEPAVVVDLLMVSLCPVQVDAGSEPNVAAG
jgi:hypothetical protein